MKPLQSDSDDRTGYVSASEISQYEFCNVAWAMEKQGYPHSRISSKRMYNGRENHKSRGKREQRNRATMKLALFLMLFLLVTGIGLAVIIL